MFENGKPLINDDPIVSLENQLGIKFPPSYLEIVRVNDGAQADPYGVEVFSRDRNRATFIDWSQLIAFVRDDKPGLPMAGFNSEGRTPHRPEGLVAFALDGGGYLFCFDFRRSEAPAVVILTNDWKDEPIIPVADDFESFLKKLARDEED